MTPINYKYIKQCLCCIHASFFLYSNLYFKGYPILDLLCLDQLQLSISDKNCTRQLGCNTILNYFSLFNSIISDNYLWYSYIHFQLSFSYSLCFFCVFSRKLSGWALLAWICSIRLRILWLQEACWLVPFFVLAMCTIRRVLQSAIMFYSPLMLYSFTHLSIGLVHITGM